ncbi:GIY-YIG nuclease family protein [Brevundimonas sp.]|uniref:GIY-YIG nuclease family protein n=1 Tax=Brevundimonas sp. TaxID=1871086 RepID=UPI0028991137|nr:hypothetical protein [Brevundimonas sp.]
MTVADAPFPHIIRADQLLSRADALARPSPVPAVAGLYGWYFRDVPPGIDADGCHNVEGLTLLYVGISPKQPPANGRGPSRSTLRQRLRTHYAGNAEGSTLRKTLGCLLAEETGYPLRRVGSGRRLTFTNPGEQALDRWMSDNAFVAWTTATEPWLLEHRLLQSGLVLPLNIRDNPSPRHTRAISQVRQKAVAAALGFPIVADGGGRRRAAS